MLISVVIVEVLYLGVWCRPFSQYWAVPPENSNYSIQRSRLSYLWLIKLPLVQCSAATNHLITNAVLNISSDIMIILLPMPVFIQSQLPTKKKVILCFVFALGTFTVSVIEIPGAVHT